MKKNLMVIDKIAGMIGMGNNETIIDTDSISDAEELAAFVPCHQTFAGLSYVNSQEPGDFSQANALGMVDKLLIVNDVMTSEVCHGNNFKRDSSPVSRAKGVQSVAKVIGLRSPVKEVHFNWVDGHEDESGGVLSRKMKHTDSQRGQRCHSEPQKSEYLNVMKSRIIVDKGTETKNSNLVEKRKDLSCPESRIKLKEMEFWNRTVKTSTTLPKKLGELLSAEIPEGELEVTDECMGLPEMYDIGLDTQMAAEAMDALFYSNPASDMNQAGQNVNTDASEGKATKRNCSMKGPCGKKLPSSLRDMGRQPKRRKISGTQSHFDIDISSGKQSNKKPVKLKPVSEEKFKKPKSNLEDNVINRSLGKDNKLVSKECQIFSPVVCRTRQSKAVNTQAGRNIFDVSGEEISGFKSLNIKGGKKARNSSDTNIGTSLSANGKSSLRNNYPLSGMRTNEKKKSKDNRTGRQRNCFNQL